MGFLLRSRAQRVLYLVLFWAILLFVRPASAQVATQWTNYYNGIGSGQNSVNAMAVDAAGNVYVTGSAKSSGSGNDYATTKYSPNGSVLWAVRYDGPTAGDDYATGIAVDGLGNVYVTGTSNSPTNANDYVTIKYSPTGVVQWTSTYHAGFDRAYAIALDSNANVYVTGISYVSGFSDDFATVKYDTNGVEQWVMRYNSPNNNYDGAYAIAVDANSNVYVTGFANTTNSSDYVTIKYDTNGVQKWVAVYNGPLNSRGLRTGHRR